MKKLIALALLTVACLMAPAAHALPSSEAEFQQTTLTDWLEVKASLIACGVEVAGFDDVMERALAVARAHALGVKLTTANFQQLLVSPKAILMDALEGAVAAQKATATPLTCSRVRDIGQSFVETLRERYASAL